MLVDIALSDAISDPLETQRIHQPVKDDARIVLSQSAENGVAVEASPQVIKQVEWPSAPADGIEQPAGKIYGIGLVANGCQRDAFRLMTRACVAPRYRHRCNAASSGLSDARPAAAHRV